MGNRKYRHNVNEVRVNKSSNSDLSGYDKMFKIKLPIMPDESTSGQVNFGELFTNFDGSDTYELQFNVRISPFVFLSVSHHFSLTGQSWTLIACRCILVFPYA